MITPEQIEFRKGKLGGSDVGAALGLNPWKTPAKLAAEILGHVEGFTDSIAARVGNHMESHIAFEYSEVKDVFVAEYGDTLQHPDYSWLICHPDYIHHSEAICRLIEIKNVGWRVADHWGKDGAEDGVPPYVVAQCAVQSMLHTAKNKIKSPTPVDVCAYFGGNDLRIYELTFTQKDLDVVLDKLIEFWAYVEAGEYPPMSAGDSALMDKLYPKSDINDPMEADENIFKLCLDLQWAKERIKFNEEDVDWIKAKVKQEMGKHDAIIYEGRNLVTWKNNIKGNRTFLLKK